MRTKVRTYGVAGRSAEFVSLPLLGAALPASVFRAGAPGVVLCMCAGLHLYVGELLRRLRSFDRLPDLNPTPPSPATGCSTRRWSCSHAGAAAGEP